MMIVLYQTVNVVSKVFVLLIIVDSVLSFFVSPYHPVREVLGRILNPLYNPIRKVVKPVNGLDFSPLIVLVIVQFLASLALRFIASMI